MNREPLVIRLLSVTGMFVALDIWKGFSRKVPVTLLISWSDGFEGNEVEEEN